MSDKTKRHWPSELRVTDEGKKLSVAFDDGVTFEFTSEYLRVESPSAEVKGHGPGQEVTVSGKRNVAILSVEQVGNYAVRINFSDGHATGLYSWGYLYKLGAETNDIWQAYLGKLEAEGLDRG